MIATGSSRLAKALKAALGAAALSLGFAASATAPEPPPTFEVVLRGAIARTVNASARRDDFGWLADLAGSCWTTDARPGAEVCFWFDASGHGLHSRQLVGERIECESLITLTAWPGLLLETSRLAAPERVQRFQLQFVASSGLIHRSAQVDHREDPRDLERPSRRWVRETFRRIDRHRFEFVQSSGRSEGYGPHHARDLRTWSCTFVRSRPWTSHIARDGSPS